MIPPALAVVSRGYARVEAVETAVLPRILQGAQPGYPIDPAQGAGGVTTGFDPVEDSLTAGACIGQRMRVWLSGHDADGRLASSRDGSGTQRCETIAVCS